MELEKNYHINSLFDFYGSLLTDKQHKYIKLYYVDDYSLGEISENFNVSRQAVYDNIKRTEKTLENYEDKMGLYKNFLIRNQQTDKIIKYIKSNYQNDKFLLEMINKLEQTEEN
ncbi:putative DNA-binding protein [Lactobacillus sp. S2-2]|uniref:putative DNA-binding protein n=1 Tax=Lactobacillus sp. S2-2 TaxID=2692917 RepID=UPI001F28693C|nr:putative DNA-binding protein [Lactobacillus sp. S2-2]MCF6515085.1 putative DNA-binding protein [Lactobacillus sp. S2-2]